MRPSALLLALVLACDAPLSAAAVSRGAAPAPLPSLPVSVSLPKGVPGAAFPLKAISQQIAPQIGAIAAIGVSAGDSAQAGESLSTILQGGKASGAGAMAVSAADAGSRVSAPPLAASKPAARPDPRARKLTETTFVVFDLETTGPYAEIHHAVQIGAVKFRVEPDGAIKILGTFERLVRPPAPMPEAFTELTGITNADLREQPSLEKIFPEFESFIGEGSVLAAHHAAFDVSFLGQHMKATGKTALPHLILDTKELARAFFPGLNGYGVKDLIEALNIGGHEAHQGLSDAKQAAQILGRVVERLAQAREAKITALTIGDLAEHSAHFHFDSILDALNPLPVEPQRLKPVPENAVEEAHRAGKVMHSQGQPAVLRDVAYALGHDYAELSAKLREAAQDPPVSPADAIVEDLVKNPPAAVIFDYDATLTDTGPNGVSLPTAGYILDGLTRLLRAGIPIGIASMRNLDDQPANLPHIPMTIWGPLIRKIPAELRAGIFFSGIVGGQLVLFDSEGEPDRYLSGNWTVEEKRGIDESIDASLASLKIGREELTFIVQPGQHSLIFKKDGPRLDAFADVLAEEFRRRGLFIPLLHNRNWIYFSKFDKGDGLRLLVAAMKAKGYSVSDENLLIVGDEFKTPPGRPAGGDAAGALAFPKSRAVSVGDKPGETLPANVKRLGIRGSRGSLRLIDAVARGHRYRPRASSAAWSRPAVLAGVSALFGAAVFAAISHAAVAGALSLGLMTLVGLPQIVKNFRQRGAATDLSLATTLIWFSAAALLSISSILTHSSLWYIGANLVSTAQSAILIAQINGDKPAPRAWLKTALVAGGIFLPAALALALAPALPVASAAFSAAMVLVLLINWPQIRQNFLLYRDEKRNPQGVSPLYPLLVWAAGLFGLIGGLSVGDSSWAFNSFVSGATTSVFLGQIFAPRRTNAFLSAILGSWNGRFAYALRRRALVALASVGGFVFSLPAVSPRFAARLSAEAAEKKAFFLDFDDTLAAHNSILPLEAARTIIAAKKAGKTIAIISDRPEARREPLLSIFESLETLPVAQREGLYVAANVGGKIFRYDAQGVPVKIYDAPEVSEADLPKLRAAAEATKARLAGLGAAQHHGDALGPPENYFAYGYGLMLKVGTPESTLKQVAQAMRQELAARGVAGEVVARVAKNPAAPSYVMFTVVDKSTPVRWLAKTLGIAAGDAVVIGDSMYTSEAPPSPLGFWARIAERLGEKISGRSLARGGNFTDRAMEKGLPGTLTLSVGGTADPRMARGYVLPGKGPEIALDLLTAAEKHGGL